MGKLTDKQERFCQEYIIDLNATQAAIRSGYSENSAQEISSQNLSKLIIQQRISELQEKTAKKLEFTQQDVLRNLILANEIALGVKPQHVVVNQGLGNGASETVSKELLKTDINAYIKVNDLLMKHLGMFEKDNDQKKPEFTINTKTMTTEELIERAKAVSKLNDSNISEE